MKKYFLILTILPILTCAQPINLDVSQANIKQTICTAGWTKTVRPPVSYTNLIKRRKLIAAGLPTKNAYLYELDHTVPIELGGAPRTAANLQLQLWPEARVKDRLETRLNHLVCQGKLPLSTARSCIFKNWRTCASLHP